MLPPRKNHDASLAYVATAVARRRAAELEEAQLDMGRLALIAIAAAVLVLIVGGVFLAVWEPSPPQTPVEKQIPDARFQK
jgi:hypothetical protein